MVRNSDIDQLVLGYIAERRYIQTRNKLFEESPDLPAKVPILPLFGDISSEKRLQTILEDYVTMRTRNISAKCAICNQCDSLSAMWDSFDIITRKIRKFTLDPPPASMPIASDDSIEMQQYSPMQLCSENTVPGSSSFERKKLNPVSNEFERITIEKGKQSGSAKRKNHLLPKRNRHPNSEEGLAGLLQIPNPNDALAYVGVKIISNMKKCVNKGTTMPSAKDTQSNLNDVTPAQAALQLPGPSLDVNDLISDETRQGLVEMTLNSLMDTAAPTASLEQDNPQILNDDLSEFRMLLDVGMAQSSQGMEFGDVLQNQPADDTDIMEIIKVDDNTPNKQPACPPADLLLYDTDEKSAVSGLLAMQNSLGGNDVTPGASGNMSHAIDIELPSIRNVRSELTEIAADVCRQESRSSYSSYADLRSIDPDDLMDACANMPPKKRFLAKENMTPEKFHGRSNTQNQRRRVETVAVSSETDLAGKDVSNGRTSVFDVPEQNSGAPVQNLNLSVRNQNISIEGVGNYVPNMQTLAFNVPEQDSRTPVQNETVSVGAPNLPSLPVDDNNCLAPNQNQPQLQPQVFNENNVSIERNHVDTTVNSVQQSYVMPTNVTDLVSASVNQTINSVLGATDLGITTCAENIMIPITSAGVGSDSILTQCHVDTSSQSTVPASDDGHTVERLGVRRSKRQIKQNLAKGNQISNSKDSRKPNTSKKRRGQSANKDRVLQPGEGRVVINLKSDGRMPIEVPGIIVRPEERRKLSKEDIIRKLVSQMQQSDTALQSERIQDRPTESAPPNPSLHCPESVLNTSEDDVLMIDEGGQTPNPETVTNSPAPGHLLPRSGIENSPQVADGNVQCEVEIQASCDDSCTSDKSNLISDYGNEANVPSTVAAIVNVGELSDIIDQHVVVVTQSHDLIINSNSLPVENQTSVFETDSTRDRVFNFYGDTGSPSKSTLEKSVPATLATPLKRNTHIFSTISPSSGIFSVIDNEGSLIFSPKAKKCATSETQSFSSLLTENSVERSLATLVEPSQVIDSQKVYSAPANEASRESISSEISDGVSFQTSKVSGKKCSSVSKRGVSGAVVGSQTKSMVRAEPQSRVVSIVKRCLVQSGTSKENAPGESETRKTRSGKVFGKESSNVNATSDVPASQAAESTQGPAPVTARPKSNSDGGNSKRKKNGHSQGQKKKLRLNFAVSNPLVNWSYEEIQAKLDAIHGKRDRPDGKNQNKSTVQGRNNFSSETAEQNENESTVPEADRCSALGRDDSSPLVCDPNAQETHYANAAQHVGHPAVSDPSMLQIESRVSADRFRYSASDPRKRSQPRLIKSKPMELPLPRWAKTIPHVQKSVLLTEPISKTPASSNIPRGNSVTAADKYPNNLLSKKLEKRKKSKKKSKKKSSKFKSLEDQVTRNLKEMDVSKFLDLVYEKKVS